MPSLCVICVSCLSPDALFVCVQLLPDIYCITGGMSTLFNANTLVPDETVQLVKSSFLSSHRFVSELESAYAAHQQAEYSLWNLSWSKQSSASRPTRPTRLNSISSLSQTAPAANFFSYNSPRSPTGAFPGSLVLRSPDNNRNRSSTSTPISLNLPTPTALSRSSSSHRSLFSQAEPASAQSVESPRAFPTLPFQF